MPKYSRFWIRFRGSGTRVLGLNPDKNLRQKNRTRKSAKKCCQINQNKCQVRVFLFVRVFSNAVGTTILARGWFAYPGLRIHILEKLESGSDSC